MNIPGAPGGGIEGEAQRTSLSDMAVATVEVYLEGVFQRIRTQGVGEDEVQVISVEFERLKKLYADKLQDYTAKQATVQYLSAWYLGVKAVVGQKVWAVIVRCDPRPHEPTPFREAPDRFEEAFRRVELVFKRIREIEKELEQHSLHGEKEETLRDRLAQRFLHQRHRKTHRELLADRAAEILTTGDFNREHNICVLGLNRQAQAIDELVSFEFISMSGGYENFCKLQKLEKEISAANSYLKILRDKLTVLKKFFDRLQAPR